ncbi:unnamed protein product [Prorocentrum cordatum]|uniref:RNA ligase (ATP) n=1 Tax=Prorocentrum cordatum TaxID=2364126 RepID=A0ABN9VTY8_9DINO|nr:unnamed protein product [Polarella glacialis]
MAGFCGYGKMGLGAPRSSAVPVSKSASWCVTEKVHGANFSVHVDRAGRLRCAKRTGFLAEHEDFFGHFAVLRRRRAGLVALAEELMAADAAVESAVLVIFGELFGGRYPHATVAPDDSARPVQTGIWYCPHVEFILFDAAVVGGGEGGLFESYSRVAGLAEKHGLLYAKPLLVGPRGLCANYGPRFATTLPAAFGLPVIEANTAEGIVVKPWDVQTPICERPIFKLKVKEFSEGDGCPPPAGDPAMRDFILSFVNDNRVAAAASKVGSPSDRDLWNEIVELVIADIVDEIGEDDQEFLRLRDQVQCEVMDLLAASAARFA